MTQQRREPVVMDGNEAVARVAYAASEAICLYPITPASPMGEHADTWAARGRPNLWSTVPRVVQMQSEAGAAGALHGAVQAGALGTTFTASQGLLLMLPNMFKIAGELTPAVIHVAARTVATHALSIFGDHSDVMAARGTGWAMLSATSPQEAHDFAAVAHAATLRSRVPFLHFMDGFQTSHELATVTPLDDADLTALFADDDIVRHRARGLDPDRPSLRGSAQNPDVFFQAREASNPYIDAVGGIVRETMRTLQTRTGRAYDLVDYYGAPDATRVVVVMGSASGTLREVVDQRRARGEAVGVCTVRLFRPFPVTALLHAVPATATAIAVLDRTKEPGAVGEPLFTDVVTAFAEASMRGERDRLPMLIGGRYGLSSKPFTPAMASAVFDELDRDAPMRRFTVGITDDVTKLSLPVDTTPAVPAAGVTQIVLHGLGSDGTVGATKNTAKILAKHGGFAVQAAFVYDSKKSGATTESHLRFSPQPITSAYLIDQADVVGCHQFGLLERRDIVGTLRDGGIFLLNAPFAPEDVWDRLPGRVQRQLIDRHAEVYVLDAYALARDAGIAGRINTVMQVALFEVAGLLPAEAARDAIAAAAEATYADLGQTVVDRNLAAIKAARGAAVRLELPPEVNQPVEPIDVVARAAALRGRALDDVDEFVRHVTGRMLAGDGDSLPVSALPVDGAFPTSTARWEKRSLAEELPSWD
ncbi:MAG: 2-oxoacid:acceptor oxidoreductase family protein, partial [Nitriliruptoraceae bacterium]